MLAPVSNMVTRRAFCRQIVKFMKQQEKYVMKRTWILSIGLIHLVSTPLWKSLDFLRGGMYSRWITLPDTPTWYVCTDCVRLKVLAMILYFIFYFFPHLVIFLQFRDPSYVLNLSTKAVLHKLHI